MPTKESGYGKDLSKEWRYWENYYRQKGCGYLKILKLSHRRMRKAIKIF
jgi:ribosomal protein L17